MSGAIGSILTNSGALAALNGIASAQQANTNYQTQLSSGKSINSPADNPAGYIQAQGFTSQLNGITQAISNANEGVSLLQTAQGAVNQQLSVAQKLNSIAVQAANGTQTAQEAQSLQGVVSQLTGQITTIAQQTQFNNINLLDGTFSGRQFQVGANEGQTLSLSIGSTTANSLGLYTLAGSGTDYIGSKGSASAAYSSGATGVFATGSLTVIGSNGNAKVNVASATTSAATIAAAVNKSTNITNVAAQANTSVQMKLTTAASGYNFTLSNGTPGAGSKNGVNITGTNLNSVVNAINANTSKTGITAQISNGSGSATSGTLVLTQSQGENIAIKNGSGTNDGALNVGSSFGRTGQSVAVNASATVQGKVSFQSDAAFSVSSAANVGLKSTSHLEALSAINVSTTSGANSAINVVKYAIEGLNNLGGQLGASQQRLQATLNNLTTTSTNLNNGLATVQDANIPQVSQKLTQTQIQAQAGVAALKSSSTLQQAYLSLLP